MSRMQDYDAGFEDGEKRGVYHGIRKERARINKIIDSFIDNADLPEVQDSLEWLKDVINGEETQSSPGELGYK